MTDKKKGPEQKPVNHGYKNLKVWEKADAFALAVYRASRVFPKEETFGLQAQLRRSALSVPLNIVKGYGRQGKKELRQFLNIALGSLAESDYLLSVCRRLSFLSVQDYNYLYSLRCETGRLLWKFYQSIKS